jgi:rRNA maturation protein Nop10
MNPCLQIVREITFAETCDICGTVSLRQGDWILNTVNKYKFFEVKSREACPECGMILRFWDGYYSKYIRVLNIPEGCLIPLNEKSA